MNKNYKLIKNEFIKEINTNATLLEHIKSGARVLLLENDDENKVFQIGFKTPPADDTGVPHILEHSTLCGSKKYPVKEPFVELLKGSLNTFLNAFTFSDKTMYPVASCNDKDFANLMDVYMDAVFFPNVYLHEEIFKQEGWHYELESLDSDIHYNGVVYNEMKGAFSSPDQVVARASNNSLFPDTAYGVESGGDPEAIPTLTYEAFKNFHSKYYHPSNSYISLYGNFDRDERLDYLDKEYLSKFDRINVDSFIPFQKPFKDRKEVSIEYPVGRDEDINDKTFYTFNAVIGDYNNIELAYAFDILTHILLNMPGAPLKEALLKAGLAKDIRGSFDSEILQPVFSVMASNAKNDALVEFKDIIKNTLNGVCATGIDSKILEAAINFFEFQYREGDFGGAPKGLMYEIKAYATWLYDDGNAWGTLKFDNYFKSLREKIGTTYFTDLIKKYLLDNTHASFVVCAPSKTLNEEREAKLKEKLAKFKSTLTKAELEKMIEDTASLKKYQATPNTASELATIPLLSKEDIKENLPKIENEEILVDGIKVLKHNYETNGVSYFCFAFDSSNVKNELVPYLGLLSNLLGMVDTKKYKYQELAILEMINSGGVSTEALSYMNGDTLKPLFVVNAKVLKEKIDFAYSFVKEIITSSDFSDKGHIHELISMFKTNESMRVLGRGHVVAASHALSYYNASASFNDLVSGINYYKFLEELDNDFDNRYNDLAKKLEEVKRLVFRPENLIINYTATNDLYKDYVSDFGKALFTSDVNKGKYEFMPNRLNEGFKTSSQVQYCGLAGSFKKVGKYNGSLKVLSMALNYDYLWTNVRVLGGAYGFLLRFTTNGDIMLGSYRDPNLSKTYDVFKKIPTYVKNLKPTDEELLKYIIGAVGEVTSPLSPREKGNRAFSAYIRGLNDEFYHNEFMEILNTKASDLSAFAKYFDAALSDNYISTIGNEAKIEEDKALFIEVKNLIK